MVGNTWPDHDWKTSSCCAVGTAPGLRLILVWGSCRERQDCGTTKSCLCWAWRHQERPLCDCVGSVDARLAPQVESRGNCQRLSSWSSLYLYTGRILSIHALCNAVARSRGEYACPVSECHAPVRKTERVKCSEFEINWMASFKANDFSMLQLSSIL